MHYIWPVLPLLAAVVWQAAGLAVGRYCSATKRNQILDHLLDFSSWFIEAVVGLQRHVLGIHALNQQRFSHGSCAYTDMALTVHQVTHTHGVGKVVSWIVCRRLQPFFQVKLPVIHQLPCEELMAMAMEL